MMVPTTGNIVTFVTVPHHGTWPKCFHLDITAVSRRRPTICFTPRRRINVTASLGASRNFYDVLGVPRDANQKQIKDAYYKLAMKHHPDKNQGILTKEFRDIKEAYDVLGNESSRMKYNNSTGSSNNKNSSTYYNDWTSSSSYDHSNTYQKNAYRTKSWSRTEDDRHSRTKYSRDYDPFKPFNVFINVISVPKNIVKTQVDVMLLSFIKNRTLKWILFNLFQYLWTWGLKNLNYNILISSSSSIHPLGEFIRSLLQNNTIRIELTEIEAIKGKAIRVKVNENEKVLVVNIPRGVQRNQSFYLFHLMDDNNDDAKFRG